MFKKINPETESPRGGVAKAALPGRSPVIKYNSFFEKFKPINDLLGFKYKEKYPDVRFSVANDDGIDPEIRQAFPRYQSSQAKDILKKIAGKDLKNTETGINAQINTNQYNKMVSNAAVYKSSKNGFTREEHFEALANIEDLYKNAVLLESSNDDKNNDPNVKIHRFASPFVFGDEIADALLTVKESIESDQKRIYSLELTEIKKLSDRGSAKPDSQHYTDSVNKLQQKHEKIKQFLEKNQGKFRFSISEEMDEAYLDAVNNGDMGTAAELTRKAAERSGLQILPKERLKDVCYYSGSLGMPLEIAVQVAGMM